MPRYVIVELSQGEHSWTIRDNSTGKVLSADFRFVSQSQAQNEADRLNGIPEEQP